MKNAVKNAPCTSRPSPRQSPLALVLSLVVAGGLAALPASAWWGECDHTAARSASVEAAGVTRVRVEARAGDLRIEGREGLGRVEAEGTACADGEERLRQVEVTAERRGDEIRVVVEVPTGSGPAALDLRLAVPAGVALEIEDSSGDVEVRGVAAVSIEDGSGEIDVERIAGNVEIRDGSGDVHVRDAGGEVRVRDGSGDVILDGVGSVRIDDDGSGDLVIEDVAGNVLVESDGSGDVRVASVRGDFVVDRDGSGSVRHRDVGGRVDVPDRD